MGGERELKPTYRIKDWDDHFETAESRKLKSTRWVPMPTKHDGKGYRRITQHNAAVEIFCAWNLIVQVASKMPTRGVLADSDGPLDADDLAAKTGFPSAIFETALPFLSSESIGWMSLDQQRRVRQSARVRQSPPESAEVPADSSLEGKGIEGNRREDKETPLHQVFEFWKTEMNKPKAQLTKERKAKIEERLKDSTVDEIQTAIRGCKRSDFHMGREPGKPQVFDDIELICRKRSKLEHFIALVPVPNGKPKVVESDEDRARRESCTRCFSTGTENVPGKGARACNHEGSNEATGIIRSGSDENKGSSADRGIRVS